MGKTYVGYPKHGPLMDVFDLPTTLKIKPNPEIKNRAKCTELQKVDFKGPSCEGVSHEDHARVLLKYVTPHLNADARAACKFEASQNVRELIIHLRSGDLLENEHHFQSTFAPCSFFHKVIHEQKFRNVRIVTEADR